MTGVILHVCRFSRSSILAGSWCIAISPWSALIAAWSRADALPRTLVSAFRLCVGALTGDAEKGKDVVVLNASFRAFATPVRSGTIIMCFREPRCGVSFHAGTA